MTIGIYPGEEHLSYAPERYPDDREPAQAWPAWDEAEEDSE